MSKADPFLNPLSNRTRRNYDTSTENKAFQSFLVRQSPPGFSSWSYSCRCHLRLTSLSLLTALVSTKSYRFWVPLVAMSLATNENLPNGHTDRWDPGADDESTPRSSSLDDNQNETIEVPFHGSCPKCHHLHTNSPFTIFKHSTKHSRFQCDVCQHHILGIGRASTQTTLASVESIPVPSNRHSLIPRPSSLQICINAPPQTSTINSPTSTSPDQLNATTQLSTITEANTLNGGSRSPSYRQVGVSASPQRGNSPSPRASLRDHGHLAQEELWDGGRSLTSPRSPSRFKALLRRGKARLLSNSGELKIFGFNIKITRARPKASRPSPPGVQRPTPDAESTPVHRFTDVAQNPGRSAPDPPSPIADASEEPADPSSVVVHDDTRPTNSHQPEAEDTQDPTVNSAEAEVEVDEDRRAATQKSEKIRALRREATLRSEAVRKPYCHCRVGCPCLGDGGESDGSNESHTAPSIIPASQVPGHLLPGLVADSSSSQTSHGSARLLSGIGSHINSSQVYAHRRISLAENSNFGGDSNRRQTNRLSQDTTAWGSDESSISLSGRRSSPGPSFAMVASHRSGGRIAVQRYDDLISHQGSPQGRESLELPNRESDVAPNGQNPGIGDATSTRLVNTPSLRPEQELGQQSPHGTSVSSDANYTEESLEQLENQDRTPRPHNHNATADNSPNGVSGPLPESLFMALANLAERPPGD